MYYSINYTTIHTYQSTLYFVKLDYTELIKSTIIKIFKHESCF